MRSFGPAQGVYGSRLRGLLGPHEYHGELDVDFVADGTSKLTVRLHTDHAEGPSIDEALQETLSGIKATAEQWSAGPRETPDA